MSVQTLIKFRRGTDTDWSNANPTLSVGEPGYDTTAEKFKIGDGTTSWSSLGYIGDGSSSGVDGSGTAGKLPKFSDSDTLTDSVISESSGKIVVVGDLLIDDASAIVFDVNGLKITDDTVGATLDSSCDDAIVIGEGSKNYADKSINIANGRFSNNGDCQKISQVLRGSTTDASRFYLSSTGSQAYLVHSGTVFIAGTSAGNTDHIILPSNAVFTFSIHISCRKQSSDDSASWIIKGAVRNSAGWADSNTLFNEASVTSTMNYNLIGSPIVESFIDSGLSGVTAEVTTSYYNSDSFNSISNAWFGVEVHGLASTNLRWSAMVEGVLTTY